MQFKADCTYLRTAAMGQPAGRPGEAGRYQRRAYYCLKGRFDTRMSRGSGPKGDLCGKCSDYRKTKTR